MKNFKNLEQLFKRAVNAIPYELTSEGMDGSFEADDDGVIVYWEKFRFPICRFLGSELVGFCCISLWRESNDRIQIGGSFIIQLEDINSRYLLPEGESQIEGTYDLENNRWVYKVL
jgi:hypothetical protein